MIDDGAAPPGAKLHPSAPKSGFDPDRPAKASAPSAETAARYVEGLTARQREIFEMILAGHPNKAIAAKLGISQRTVENHRAGVMKKTKSKSLPDLVRLAIAAKWFSAPDPFEFSDDLTALLDVEPILAVGRAMFEHAPVAMIMVDAAAAIVHFNPASQRLFGYEEAELIGKPIDILVPDAVREHHKLLRDRFLQAPTIRPMKAGGRLTARCKDGREVPVAIGLRPLVTDGRPVVVLLSIADETDRERAERAELFARELAHRAKNLFTVLLAISRQIGRTSKDVSSFQSAFEKRLRSFAESYRVLERNEGRGAFVEDLVRSQLSLFNGADIPQIRIEGPKLKLPPGATEYLGLAIHELATNAIKYGALAARKGVVEICWAADAAKKSFQFDWIEHGGAAVSEPNAKGFGSVILEVAVPTVFGGKAALSGSAEGMLWRLEAPLPSIT